MSLTFFHFEAAEKIFEENQVDYFFSLVNSKILPSRFINKVQKLTVNYHNAPLPRYAGVNATCWAILNNESWHGVTLHVVNDLIDGGDILKQTTFPIEHDETALSLNLKFYQHALKLFAELVTDLKSSQLKRIVQDLTQRTYYGCCKKPKSNGLIDWDNSGEEIERTYRAFSLRNYSNRFATLKIMIGDNIYIVNKLSLSSDCSDKEPGFLIITKNSWKIATKTSMVNISNLCTIDGKPIKLKNVAKYHHLQSGSILTSPSEILRKSYQELSTTYCANEAYWVKKLQLPKTMLPFLDSTILVKDASFKKRIDWNIPKNLLQEFCNDADAKYTFILTIWSVYLYRLGNSQLNMAISHPKLLRMPHELTLLMSVSVPLNLKLTTTMSFMEAFTYIKHRFDLVTHKMSYLKDIYYRYPELSGINPDSSFQLIFSDEDNIEPIIRNLNSYFLIVINAKNNCVSFYLKESIIRKNKNLTMLIDNMPGHLETLSNGIKNNADVKISELPILSQQIELISEKEWKQKLRKIDESNPLFQLLPVYGENSEDWLQMLYKLSHVRNDHTIKKLQALQ